MDLGHSGAAHRFSNPQVQQLVQAAEAGDVAAIDELVAAGVDVNAQGEGNTTPLVWAMTAHSYRGVAALLAHGANPNQRYDDGYTPLWFAAGGNDLKLLEMLLQHGGDPNIWVAKDMNPLMFAIQQDRMENYHMLLKYGADLNSVSKLHASAATYTVGQGNFKLAYQMLESGYKPELDDDGFARAVYIRQIETDSEQYSYKQKVIALLKAKGIVYPPPPPPPAGDNTRLDPAFRADLEAMDKAGKLPKGSRGREILDHDRDLEREGNNAKEN